MANNNRDPISRLTELADDLEGRSDDLAELRTPNMVRWIDRNAITVDGNSFDWNTHRYLKAIYGDDSPIIIQIKAAQMGASVYSMLKMLKRSVGLMPYNTGYYLPTESKTIEFSQVRFDPMCDSNLRLRAMKEASDTWRAGVKRLGSSNIYFSYTEGKVSTESTPLDGVFFDEVRRMNRGRIDLILERLSHSRYKHQDYLSTAGYPNSDIDWYYQQSDQHEWWVKCQDCGHFFLPHEEFPRHCQKQGGRWGLSCPKCGCFDVDPQGDGSLWIPAYPQNPLRGYHPTQLISKYISLDQVMHAFYTTDDIAEFWRSKLGVPFLDKNTILVQPEDLNSCIDTSLDWWFHRKRDSYGVIQGANDVVTVMGIDQQAGWNIVVIKAVLPNGLTPVLHLEYSYGGRPFDRAAELMREYDIDICVADRAPNFNDAIEFARHHPKRVWLASYRQLAGGEIVVWADRTKTGERQTAQELRDPWDCSVNRVVGMEWSLKRFEARGNRIPHPDGLIWEVKPKDLLDPLASANIQGQSVQIPICRKLYFEHLQRLAKVRDPLVNERGAEIVGEARYRFDNIGCDPHFAHANLYADIAMSRALKHVGGRRSASSVWYEEKQEDDKPDTPSREHLVEARPGVWVTSINYDELPPTQAVCASCQKVFAFNDTRAVGDGRHCLNCMTGEEQVKPIEPKKKRKAKKVATNLNQLYPSEVGVTDGNEPA